MPEICGILHARQAVYARKAFAAYLRLQAWETQPVTPFLLRLELQVAEGLCPPPVRDIPEAATRIYLPATGRTVNLLGPWVHKTCDTDQVKIVDVSQASTAPDPLETSLARLDKIFANFWLKLDRKNSQAGEHNGSYSSSHKSQADAQHNVSAAVRWTAVTLIHPKTQETISRLLPMENKQTSGLRVKKELVLTTPPTPEEACNRPKTIQDFRCPTQGKDLALQSNQVRGLEVFRPKFMLGVRLCRPGARVYRKIPHKTEVTIIFNLSDKVLTMDHYSILNKGLTFVTVSKPYQFLTEVELYKLQRILNSHELRKDNTTTYSTPFPTRQKREINTPNASIKAFLQAVKSDIDGIVKDPLSHSHKLTISEREVLKDLKQDK
ncbi:Hypothetical predicted protein [Pelobates cultripes]|uniref:Uncharacterized protein n=1 Tax=Pelobates cultripes TaxID=61616 RepID=A0AAD1SC28_PELCU|nr:Hypothetical predicted protein [Pelobates cultripes]